MQSLLIKDKECSAIEKRLRAMHHGYSKVNIRIDLLKPKIPDATRRAQELDNHAKALWPSFPGTHVYRVVQSLPLPSGL